MGKNNILMKLKEKFTPTIYSIGMEYYKKRIGGITALYADGNLVTLDGEFQENKLYHTSLTLNQKTAALEEASCDCMFFQNNKKHGACKHIVALSIIADKSEKINNIVGTDDFEVLFEDDFEEENKKEEIVKVKKEETKNENLEKDGEKKDLKRSERKSLEQKKEVSDFSDKKNNKKVGILSEIEENKKVKKEEDKEDKNENFDTKVETKKEKSFDDLENLENVESISQKIDEIYNFHLQKEKVLNEDKKELRLEVEIDEGSYSDYKYGYDYNEENNIPDYILRIKTGFQKTYYVKDIIKFVQAIVLEKEFEITSKIKYEPEKCYFSEINKNIILAIYEYSKQIQTVIENGIKDKKGLKVYDMLLNKLLFAMEKGKNFLLLGEDKQVMSSYEPIFVFENGKIEMREIEKINETSPFYHFENDSSKIFKMAENEAKFLEKFDFIDAELVNQLPKKESEKLKKTLEFEDINVAEYVEEDGEIDIFVLETEEDEIVKVNISNTVCATRKGNKYYIPRRNVELFEKLEEIIGNFAISNPTLAKNIYILNYEGLSKLSEIIDKKYFDKVKIHLENKIKNARSINVGVEVKKASNNFLDVNFEIEGIKPQDVEIVTEAIKKEKKFITLSSGELVKIANKSMEELLGIVDSIGNIKIGKNRISKVKALQLAQISKNIKNDLEKLDEFRELFHKIKNRKEVEPKNVKVSLFPYQKLGFNWLKNMYDIGFGGILADDMGLGKTLQTISLLNEVYQENKDFLGLIIVPSSLLYNWKEEIIKFTGITPTLVEGVASNRKKIIANEKNGFLITTYQALRNDIEEYKNRNFDIVVLDEAQNIKTTTSQIKKAVMKINSKVNFALTGTPVENNILELWSIFDFVIPGYLDSLSKFKKTYKEAIVNPNSSKINNLREIIAPFLLRRTKKEVLTELPEKMESNVFVTLSSEQKQLYLSYVKQAKKEMKKFDKNENNRIKILAILTKLRQICNSPALFKEDYSGEVAKIEVLKDLMPDITENGHRLLIFSQFVGTLKEIEKELTNMGIEYFYIDGNVKSKERVEICNRFNDGERQVVLISLKAGGTGLNLVGADVVIHYDPWWNIAVENQASDRAYRIGQKKSVQVIKLVTEGTIEEKIIKIQEKKRQLSENLLESKDGEKVLFEMSDKELMELLG
jgi:non-specific serine/threonine protein kinase